MEDCFNLAIFKIEWNLCSSCRASSIRSLSAQSTTKMSPWWRRRLDQIRFKIWSDLVEEKTWSDAELAVAHLGAGVVMPPERSNLVLSTHVLKKKVWLGFIIIFLHFCFSAQAIFKQKNKLREILPVHGILIMARLSYYCNKHSHLQYHKHIRI